VDETEDQCRWRGIREVNQVRPRRRVSEVKREKLGSSKRSRREWMR
jgi:hypothetical protein